MQQYYRFKKRHPDCILLFRIGDFYEAFDEDAVTISKALALTLTQRTEGVPMAGVPHHQLEVYLRRLIAAGFRVAVADQLIDASQARGLVPRAVTRVISPGTLVDESLLDPDSHGSLGALAFLDSGERSRAALAIIDVSTGEFLVTVAQHDQIIDELARHAVRELLYCDTAGDAPSPRVRRILDALRLSGTPRPAWQFRPREALDALREHFAVATLAGFGLADDAPEVLAAGAIIRYLRETQTLSEEDARAAGPVRLSRATLRHLRPPRRDESSQYCLVDAVSLRALEVERTIRGADTGSLLSIFCAGPGRSLCRTGMGRRLLRDWLCRPLRDRSRIEARQNAISAFVEDRTLSAQVGRLLDEVQDTARIAARIAMARATPRDLVALARSLQNAAPLAALLAPVPALAPLASALQGIAQAATDLARHILASCVDEPPPHLRDAGVIRDGVDADLDEARLLQRDAGAWLAQYQKSLIERHALPGLKVGYHRTFGYHIELPAAQARTPPPEFTRTQTLRGAERFTTPELRDFERKVTAAQSRALERERELFAALCEMAHAALDPIASFTSAAAELDATLTLADKAVQRAWVRPRIVDEPVLAIHAGRHPVLDETLQTSFVPNDVELGTDGAPSLALITGPNMAGKSTYIRQTALLCLLAMAGSFIPADRATIGLIDRIFTRIGADDALHAGQSTFMVEMIETANILNHATPRSLIVLDEVGRGTSTLDGLSLAWAIAEHLAGRNDHGPRTLFATHYHELTQLEDLLPGRVRNLHVAVREWPAGDDHAEIIFLHRILPGRTDKSYGLHVARLAGMPPSVIARGREILAGLSVEHSLAAPRHATPSTPDSSSETNPDGQLGLFTRYLNHPALDALREIKLDTLTPLQAFDTLRRLKARVEET
jgi:DNA mismatch repair protein MutS